MEEDAYSSSIVSPNPKMNFRATENSDSNSNDYTLPPSKRTRHDHNNNFNISSSSTIAKFKGVVPHQNGNWGAQIYANHQRIWLGTFKSEHEAAMAYDSAAIKLRPSNENSHRNFPWTNDSNQELGFQNLYTTEAVLDMIRDGSYQSKFADFLRTQSQISGASINKIMLYGHGHCVRLFRKELTPSDVGKLNRLVIPKKYAVKYFPYICENEELNGGGGVCDIELVFYDKLMRSWKFRYCYWRSSQSFVFTRGWNRFVKDKNLKEKDIVTFYTCDNQQGQNFFLIDVNYFGDDHQQNCTVDHGVSNINYDEMQVELELNLGRRKFSFKVDEEDDHEGLKEERLESRTHDLVVEDKRFRLFGVRIN